MTFRLKERLRNPGEQFGKIVCYVRDSSHHSTAMLQRIAVFGGSFNPPGLHHLRIAEALCMRFDEVIVVPCGPRDDKSATNLLPPIYRAVMADLTFSGVPNVEVDLFDLEQETFTRTCDLDRRYSVRGEVWHVVGVDLIKGGATGNSEVQRSWMQGSWLWQHARFAVFTRPGYELNPADLPPNHELMELNVPGASSEIRQHIAHGEEVGSLVTPKVLAYIQRYGLYRAPIPSSWARGTLQSKRWLLQTDSRNPKAAEWAASYQPTAASPLGADFVTVIGGDGAMLRTIREHWRTRLPFYGINAGHLGFLMNSARTVEEAGFPPRDIIVRQLPMLYLEMEDCQGNVKTAYGFNDAWVERATSQSSWLEVDVNGVRRLNKLVSDGALVSTAAGSTAYARSMGASPLLADTPAWLLVGSNVMEPVDWKSALLTMDSVVELRCMDPEHRPIRAYVDGQDYGIVTRMRARISRAAAAEVVFNARHDMAEKIAALQFRGTGIAEEVN